MSFEHFLLFSSHIFFIFLRNLIASPNTKVLPQSHDWAYHGPTGPQYWPELYPEYCSGDSQSPVDIVSSEVERASLPGIVLNGYGLDDIPEDASMQIVNNGHSVQVNLEGNYHMEGGPLVSVFQLDQLHFHWGSVEDQGSEHTIDGKQFDAEIHMVHYDREKFDNFDDAVLVKNGVAVLAIWIEVVDESNPAFDPLLQGVASVPFRGDTYNFPEVFPISGLLPNAEDQLEYYFYEGSLTTPTCNEVLQWVVYKKPVQISKEQIDVFRSVYENEVTEKNRTLVDNFRPTQPLNDRPVFSAKASILTPPSLFLLLVSTAVTFFTIQKGD